MKLAPYLVCLLLLFFVGYLYLNPREKIVVQTKEVTVVPAHSPEPDADELWGLVNGWRQRNGYPIYKKDDALCGYALRRVNEVSTDFTHDKFFTMTPEAFKKLGYSNISENLAQQQTSSQEVLDQWLSSPSHLQNLVKDYNFSCIETDGKYTVQLFAR